MEQTQSKLWRTVKWYFNALPDKEDEAQTIEQISSGVVFNGANLWVLILAIFIASLGLNVNSTAVIIGAMLISPLMGPIIGMGLAVGISDLDLLKRSAKNYLVATVISVLTAAIYFSLSPITEARSELLARTSPTLYDVLIALLGGAAGILALATKGKGNVLPGVAIATALMPPLCTAGYGLAVGQASFFFGAIYLFFINTVFIALATYVGVRMMHFRSRQFVEAARLKKVRMYIMLITVATLLPATYMTVQIIKDSIRDNNTNSFVKNELSVKGDAKQVIKIVSIGKLISKDVITRAQKQLPMYRLGGYRLQVIQGYESDSLLLTDTSMGVSVQSANTTKKQLIEQVAQMQTLQNDLAKYTRYEKLSGQISAELKAISPQVRSIILTPVQETSTDSVHAKRYVIAVLSYNGRMSQAEYVRLQQWLKARSEADSLRLLVP